MSHRFARMPYNRTVDGSRVLEAIRGAAQAECARVAITQVEAQMSRLIPIRAAAVVAALTLLGAWFVPVPVAWAQEGGEKPAEKGDETPADVAAAVRDYADDLRGELPPSVTLAIWDDDSEILTARIDLLVRKRFLNRRRGSGTYVCEQRKEVAFKEFF